MELMMLSMKDGSQQEIEINEIDPKIKKFGNPIHLYKIDECTPFIYNDMIFVVRDKTITNKFQYKVFSLEGFERHPIDIDVLVQPIEIGE